jgi:hypothetical protein
MFVLNLLRAFITRSVKHSLSNAPLLAAGSRAAPLCEQPDVETTLLRRFSALRELLAALKAPFKRRMRIRKKTHTHTKKERSAQTHSETEKEDGRKQSNISG